MAVAGVLRFEAWLDNLVPTQGSKSNKARLVRRLGVLPAARLVCERLQEVFQY